MSAPAGTMFARAPGRALVGLSGAAILLSALAAYHNALRAPFEFDDIPSITDNASIRSLWPPWGALSPPSLGTSVGGRPVANLTLAVNHALGGDGVWGYHAANILILALGGLALFGIVRRTLVMPALGGRFARDCIPLALAVSLLWTLHPLQTESVTYVIQRVESLMGLFYLLTLYGFIRSLDSGRPLVWRVLTVAACLLGMATKEVMATAPLMVLLYDRTFVAGSIRDALRRRWGLYLALAATWLPLAVLVAGTGWSRGGTAGFGSDAHPGAYWLAQFGAVARYLRLSVWPGPLVFDYGTVLLGRPAESALCALVVIPLVAAVVLALMRRSPLGFLGCWFLVILAPTSLVPVATQTMAEHRMYLPLAAVAALIVLGGYALAGRRILAPLAVVAAVLGLLTAGRNEDYKNPVTLWRDTVLKQPRSARAHCALGMAMNGVAGMHAEAVAQLEEAIRIEPGYALAHNGLGVAIEEDPGRKDEAVAHYREALRIDPDFAVAHHNLGVSFAKSGNVQAAIPEFEAAVRAKPDYAEALSNLGVALCVSGRTQEGIGRMEDALRISPGLAMAHFNLGKAMEASGRAADATRHYEEALRLKPELAEADNNLGLLLCRTGRVQDGMAHIEAAIRTNPGYARAHAALGTVLLQQGRREEATAEFERALALDPNDPTARGMLDRLRGAR